VNKTTISKTINSSSAYADRMGRRHNRSPAL
jgi:hypothetical protein